MHVLPLQTKPKTGFQPPYRLRLPGPTAVPERVRLAMLKPVVDHRGPEFVAYMEEINASLQDIAETTNVPLLFTTSGTGVMEATLANIAVPGEKVLVAENGQFAERFLSIAAGLGLQADTIDLPWGDTVSPEEVEQRLAADDYVAVIVIHNESSTGAVTDLQKIGAVVRKTPALFVVDSISGLGGLEVRQDEWGIDILLCASQKAFMCAPGIGIAFASPKAWNVIDRDVGMPRYYWDFRIARDAALQNLGAFTPAVTLTAGLCESLRMIAEEGMPQVLRRHKRHGEAMRQGAAALGLAPFPVPGKESDTVAVFKAPDGIDGDTIVDHMYRKYGTVIAGSRSRLSGKIIRIGTMGSTTDGDILLDLQHLEQTFADLGLTVSPGAAVAAASAVLSDV